MPIRKKDGSGRTRNYATIVYPESAPKDWIEIIKDTHVATLISPLHDKDINPDGTPKKPHYHVLMMYDSVKTLQQALSVFKSFGGVGYKIIDTKRGYTRYLCHLDNPEKAQYPTNEVRELNGADYWSIVSLASDKYRAVREMIDYVQQNNILTYADLLDYSANNREDWFRVLCDSGTYVVSHYIKSLAYKQSLKK